MINARDNNKRTITVPVTKQDGDFQRAFRLKRGLIGCRKPGCDRTIDLTRSKNARIRKTYAQHGAAYCGRCFYQNLRPLVPFYRFWWEVIGGGEAMRLVGRLEAFAEIFEDAEQTAKSA